MSNMFDAASVPSKLPEPGFYYHNKHDPAAGFTDHAYEMLGVGYHTETGEYTVLYRPLYREAFSYEHGLLGYNRPLAMFMDTIMKEGKESPRFIRVTDSRLIQKLAAVRDELYPNQVVNVSSKG